jgi:hypothetical protein
MRGSWFIGGLGVAVLFAWAGCSDDEDAAAPAGAGAATGSAVSTASSTSPSSSSAGGSNPCAGAPDGVCDVRSGEGCACVDCVDTGLCDQGACIEDDGGYCDPDLDSCWCSDCDHDYNCGDPADYNCLDDGLCEPDNGNNLGEGCNCSDCWTDPNCSDNVAACEGGAPDDVCNAPAEDCACPDCLGAVGCDPCTPDDTCSYEESCHCVDCLAEPFCTDPQNCYDDSICAPMYEGCHCVDCATAPSCTTGAGGSGGN